MRSQAPFVSVAVRVKPADDDESVAIWAKPPAAPGEGSRRVCCHRGYLLEEYEFSRVFGPEDENSQLFRDLQGPDLTTSVFSGVNETLFAYGQTGSGKTHTIFGTDQESGLLQLFVRSIFHRADLCNGSTIHACCYEVLGDTLTDLIDAEVLIDHGELNAEDVVYDELFIKTQKCRYQIVRVSCVETCLSLLQDARINRSSGVSSCNLSSSRSHAVVHLFVQNPTARENGSGSSIGALTLVDLAGTEKEHENPSEHGRKSARLLNTSLSSLNRLLRKLQTGSLDESERRQSVLNKCLWEYLRPGCGVALIFCASPLLRHRAATLSTLSMATASKTIQSQRKSQFLQFPVAQEPYVSARSSGHGLLASPVVASGRMQGYAHGPDRSPRPTLGRCSPGRVPQASRTGPEFCMTPRMLACGTPRQDPQIDPELETTSRYSVLSSATVQNIAVQNDKLRRKLSKSRARSQERVSQVERQSEQLCAENLALQRECESLRALFIQQQQQQIAFWTGPFMDMIAHKDGAARPASAAIWPGLGRANNLSSDDVEGSVAAPSLTPHVLSPAPQELRGQLASKLDDSLQTVIRERDYWRLMASELQRDMMISKGRLSKSKALDDQSTSNSPLVASDPSLGKSPGSEASSSEVSRRRYTREP